MGHKLSKMRDNDCPKSYYSRSQTTVPTSTKFYPTNYYGGATGPDYMGEAPYGSRVVSDYSNLDRPGYVSRGSYGNQPLRYTSSGMNYDDYTRANYGDVYITTGRTTDYPGYQPIQTGQYYDYGTTYPYTVSSGKQQGPVRRTMKRVVGGMYSTTGKLTRNENMVAKGENMKMEGKVQSYSSSRQPNVVSFDPPSRTVTQPEASGQSGVGGYDSDSRMTSGVVIRTESEPVVVERISDLPEMSRMSQTGGPDGINVESVTYTRLTGQVTELVGEGGWA